VPVPDSEGLADHTGPESCAGVGNGGGAALTGEGTGSGGSPAIGRLLGADALRTRGRHPRRRREGEAATAPAGAATSAGSATRWAESGRACRGPGEGWPGPHGAPTGQNLGLAAKVRPCLILSEHPADDEFALVIIILHTTAIRGNRWELTIPKPFLRPGVFHLQQIQPISLARLERKLGALMLDEFQRIKSALARLLKLTPLT
jgi:mRNA interferase MazF